MNEAIPIQYQKFIPNKMLTSNSYIETKNI